MRSFSKWTRERIEAEDLTGYARERAEEALQSDPTLAALWKASREVDDRQSGLRTFDEEEPADLISRLVRTRQACDGMIEELSERVIREAIEGVEVHGHTVDLRQATDTECPACEEPVEAFYLGGNGEALGWVCGHCGATLEEDVETGEIETVEGGDQ